MVVSAELNSEWTQDQSKTKNQALKIVNWQKKCISPNKESVIVIIIDTFFEKE